MGVHGAEVRTSVKSADGEVKADPGYIHWVTACNSHATSDAAIELEDTGTDVWAVVLVGGDTANGPPIPIHAVFDPPIECKTGITVDITGGTVLVTVGYT